MGSALSLPLRVSPSFLLLLDQSTKPPLSICYDASPLDLFFLLPLSAPTEEFPIALVSDDIHVFPTSINKIEVRYYKYPAGRNADGTRNDGQPTYATSGTSIDFELPEHYTSDLVYEIGKMIGVNLRDADIVNYTGQEMMTRKQAETL